MENVTNLLNNVSDSRTMEDDDRPLSPVLNSSGSSQKAIYNRKRNRLKSKVNLIGRFSSEETTASSTSKVLLGNPKLLDNLNVGEKMMKIKEIEETQRKFANYFYINQESDSNIKTEVSTTLNTFDFKKPMSPVVTKQPKKSNCNTFKNQNSDCDLKFEQIKDSHGYGKSIHEGFRTGSGKEVITSVDSIKKQLALFEDMLTPEELERNLHKSNLVSKIPTDNYCKSQSVKMTRMKDIGNKTILQTSITDTQFNLAGDIAISVDFDSWTNAGFDTSIIANKNIVTKYEDDFKGFDEPLTKFQLECTYTTLIKHLEEEISLILNKTNFPSTTNKRSLSSFTSNPSKRFKFDNEAIPSQFDSTELMCCDNEGISKVNELEIKTEVHLQSRDSNSSTALASFIYTKPKEEKIPNFSENNSNKNVMSHNSHKTASEKAESSNKFWNIKEEFSALVEKPIEAATFTNNNMGSNFSSGFYLASGKNIEKLSSKAWNGAHNMLKEDNLPTINKKQIKSNKTPKNSSCQEFSAADSKFSAFVEKPIEAATITNKNFNAGANFSSGFYLASGKNIEKLSSKAWSKADNMLKEDNLPTIDEKKIKSNKAPNSSFHQGFSVGDSKCPAFVEKPIETTKFSNAGANFSSGFYLASGKNIEKLSNEAWKRGGNILQEDNLPVIKEKPIKSNRTREISSHQGFNVGGSSSASQKNIAISTKASCIIQKENLPRIAEYQNKSKPSINTNLYEKFSSTNNVNQEIQELKDGEDEFKNKPLFGNTSGGCSSASRKNFYVATKKVSLKSNNLLKEDDFSKIEVTSQNFSNNMNKDLKLPYDLNSPSNKNELPSVSIRSTVLANQNNVVRKKRIPFQSPIRVSPNKNVCHESKSTPAQDDKNNLPNLNKSEPSVNNLHTPKNDIKRSTVSKSIRKRLGVSASSKQILVHKENLQRASLIFEEAINEKPTFTNVNKSNIYSSTPVKKCDVITKPNIEMSKTESTCLNNVNLTPIRNSNVHKNVIKEVKLETKIDLLHDQNSDIIFKKCSTINSLEHINREYQSVELQLQNLLYKKQVLESQRGFLTRNKDCSPISITQGVLTKRKFSQQRISWGQYLGNVEPGTISIDQALENGVSSVVLAISPKNATDVHFNCDRNDQHKSVVHTEDGAIVVSNSKNLIGLLELIAAFEVMPGVAAKLLPRNWISNHFKWIVWKLASLERNFPDKFSNFLSVENVVQQLKHRYDREIDNAQRPALRKIFEKDDVPQKKMVLCVADIIEISPDCFEMELTDGWYSIRTIIDRPLCKQVKTNKIVVGTKLITQYAELLNCDDGCHPLEASGCVRLKIFYNCTRRAKWNSKLGYQRVLEPFPIGLHTILPDGGCIGCIKVFIARVYPLRYMEKQANGLTVSRNKRAEDKRAQEWETARAKAIESIQHKVQRDFETETLNDMPKCKTSLDKQTLLAETYSPNVLLEMLENTNDPEGFNNMLSSDQLAQIMDYKMKFQHEQQQDLSSRMDMELKNLKLQPRNVTPVLKLCVTELNEETEVGYTFNIYKPTEEHLQSITEGSAFTIYNVLPKHNGEIVSNNKTHFKLESTSVKVNKMRSVIPIASLCQTKKSMFNEFDTVGTIVQLHITDNTQKIWLTDFVGNLLLVKVVFGPDKCSLLDNLNKGHSIALVNLISCACKYGFDQAIANQSTLVTRYPRHSLLQELLLEHCNQLGKDLTNLMNECDKKIEKFEASLNGSKSNNNTSANSLMEPTNLCDLFDDSYQDTTEIAMSLIDMDQYFDNSSR